MYANVKCIVTYGSVSQFHLHQVAPILYVLILVQDTVRGMNFIHVCLNTSSFDVGKELGLIREKLKIVRLAKPLPYHLTITSH